MVVFLPAAGGRPLLVTGERDWRRAPIAHALGWTREGLARVAIYTPWRGRPPGVYLFDPHKPARDARPTAPSAC